MAARKHARKKSAAKSEDSSAPRAEATVPTYAKPREIAAARAMHGSDYEKLIAAGKIVAPTREELSDEELAEQVKKHEPDEDEE